jgi:hypothetical protein
VPGDAPDPITVESRRLLLDALTVLAPHVEHIVLVGAHAIYLHTEDVVTGVALFTTDADLALVPPLEETPDIERLMRAAGFSEGRQPGSWENDGGQVDLLVPEALASPAGRRAARLPGHGRPTARKVSGIEGAAVDNTVQIVRALDPDDLRSSRVRVAGPGALLISKAFKLAERLEEPGQDRLADKDAFDALRLLQLPAARLVGGITRMRDDERTRPTAEIGIEHVRRYFATADAIGSVMAGRSVEGVGDPTTVRLATSALADELLRALSV